MVETIQDIEFIFENYLSFWAEKLRRFGFHRVDSLYLSPEYLDLTPINSEITNRIENFAFFTFPTPVFYKGDYKLWQVFFVVMDSATKRKVENLVKYDLKAIKLELIKKGYLFPKQEYINTETIYLIAERLYRGVTRKYSHKTWLIGINKENVRYKIAKSLSNSIYKIIGKLNERIKYRTEEQSELILFNLEFAKKLNEVVTEGLEKSNISNLVKNPFHAF